MKESQLLEAIEGSSGNLVVVAKRMQVSVWDLIESIKWDENAIKAFLLELLEYNNELQELGMDNLEKLLIMGDRKATFFVMKRVWELDEN